MQTGDSNFAVVIHGGAGNMALLGLEAERATVYKDKMTEALTLGYDMLARGDIGVNVVESVIKVLEDSPLFNAGKGSVFANSGINEMDAAIMEGNSLKAGAVASVQTIKNPISAARAVMEKSEFVFLSGQGAEQFASDQSLEIVPRSYFHTKERWDELLRVRDTEKIGSRESDTKGLNSSDSSFDKYGTVGCVVRDLYGNLVAGTSTGGITNKKYSRIGDSPLIGAGTYANNKTCAVSCTGHGEDFIRIVAAHEVSTLMAYKDMSLHSAADHVINKRLKDIGGRGGLIAVDYGGNISMQFNTRAMFRGYVNRNGIINVCIFKED